MHPKTFGNMTHPNQSGSPMPQSARVEGEVDGEEKDGNEKKKVDQENKKHKSTTDVQGDQITHFYLNFVQKDFLL